MAWYQERFIPDGTPEAKWEAVVRATNCGAQSVWIEGGEKDRQIYVHRPKNIDELEAAGFEPDSEYPDCWSWKR